MSSFVGSEISTVDVKGRINVPARLRRGLSPEAADSFTIVRGWDGCVNMYPLDEWRLFAAELRRLSIGNEEARAFIRILFDSAHESTIDGQGRVTMTRKLLDLAGIAGQAKLLGVDGHIEVWNPKRFDEQAGRVKTTYEEMLRNLMGTKENG